MQAGARAWSASSFLRRALIAERVPAPHPDGGSADAQWHDWLVEVAAVPWTAQRIRAQFMEEAAAAGAADSSALLPPPLVSRALRRTRRRLLCGLLVRECAGLATLEEVTGSMTDLAELAVRELLAVLAPPLAQQHGMPVDGAGAPLDLLVLGMGKAGRRELNVSSDLDLIFVYAADARLDGDVPARGRREPLDGQRFFELLGRQLISALGQPDADGFVFRVDMRLRPHGDSGPLVVSVPMLEEYLLREGREWERFAWAKSRVISAPVFSAPAGFAAQCRLLDSVVHPFVYRRYFDFGAIGAIRELHQRIRSDALRRGSRTRRGAQQDIKLGRGGIREIEFLAQIFCIMRGGRDPRLRGLGTVQTLQVLARIGLMPAAEAQALIDHYRFLRRLEHALQWRDDAQTHAVPQDAAALDALAIVLGMGGGADLLERLAQATSEVEKSFDAMFPADAPGAADAAPRFDAESLAGYGLTDPQAAAQRLARLFASPRMSAMPAPARAAVEQLALQALSMLGSVGAGAVPPDELLLRWIRLVEVIGGRNTYFSLLAAYPAAHERVLRLLAAGGWPTEYLLRHPILLDELIDPPGVGALAAGAPPGGADAQWRSWAAELDELLRASDGDTEGQMNLLRDAHHAQVFRLLLQDLAGGLSVERLADHLSALADAVLGVTLRAVWRSIDAAGADPATGPATESPTQSAAESAAQAIPAPPRTMPQLAIVAYGKLGGRELGYASDLDLAFVYQDRAQAENRALGIEESRGRDDPGALGDARELQESLERPAPAGETDAALCTQLARRMIAWLTTATSSGKLFEIDLRLRPNGNDGLLVTPIDAFERYQLNVDGHGAWVWEHQALTRARVCAGDALLAARVHDIRARVLTRRREPAPLAREVVAMRERMLEGHVNRSDRFDIKHDRGGMVDIEFIVQFLVLAHAHTYAELLDNRGNIALLMIAARLGLIAPGPAAACAAAYRRYRRLQHALRLDGHEQARVDGAAVAAEVGAVTALWCSVFGTAQPLPPAARAARPRR